MKIPSKIERFNLYTKKPSAMKYGYYYDSIFDLKFSKENKRHVRVWLPEDYEFDNPDKRYPVIYFSDGQNLVDRCLSAYGEWELDKTVHKLLKEGLKGVIAVGIDCPKDPLLRTLELCPPYTPKKEITRGMDSKLKSYADKYVDYIANVIKPVIDNLAATHWTVHIPPHHEAEIRNTASSVFSLGSVASASFSTSSRKSFRASSLRSGFSSQCSFSLQRSLKSVMFRCDRTSTQA